MQCFLTIQKATTELSVGLTYKLSKMKRLFNYLAVKALNSKSTPWKLFSVGLLQVSQISSSLT